MVIINTEYAEFMANCLHLLFEERKPLHGCMHTELLVYRLTCPRFQLANYLLHTKTQTIESSTTGVGKTSNAAGFS